MTVTNTVCVSQEGPANALALNKDCSQVVIAGRNVFKVFAIGENEFTELSNLRVGKNLNLNYSSIDVAWSAIEENTLATAATNGAVVVWNLGKSGRSKQEHVFSDHKRTVNKVSFHLTEPSLLISGSQDGMMKCFDLRMKEVARTFLSNTESIRDVQFSPLWAHQFAAVSENGSVQLWDVRRHERCLQQFTAHSGPVFACDWHPNAPWLATASRDKTIKVWDMQNKPTLEHTIHTIASVGHVKWRPQKKYHISSCALVLDWSVQVWDVRRPCLPLATFASHRDVTTCVAWLGSPHAFVATSRDAGLYRHAYASASHPSLWSGGHALAVGPKTLLAAAPARAMPTHLLHANSLHQHGDHDANTQLGRKQPLAGALSPTGQAQLEKIFPESAGSVMLSAKPSLSQEPRMVLTAQEGQPPSLAAKENARKARMHDRHLTAHVWEVVSALFAGEAPLPLTNVRSNGQLTKLTDTDNGVGTTSDEMSREGDWPESQFLHSGVLGLPTATIYIPPDTFAPVSDDGSGWVCAARVHYVDSEATEWTLPEEALTHNKANATIQTRHPDNNTTVSSKESCSPGGSSGDSVSTQNVFNLKTPNTGMGVCALSLGRRALAQCLRQLAAMGDVATPVHVLTVLGEHRNDLFPYIEESLQEQWLLSYIELLHRKKEYNLATEVIRSAWLPSVSGLSEQSTSVSAGSNVVVCCVCGGAVRGLVAWCQGCAHGGHLAHLKQWGQTHQLCAAGCGHRCQVPS